MTTVSPSPGQISIIILAAGLGTRMKSDRAKVLHEIHGRPMIDYVVRTARNVAGSEVILVIGHQADRVRQSVGQFPQIKFAVQDQQLGTGHAVACALPKIDVDNDTVVILCGDIPLLRTETVSQLVDDHQRHRRDLTLLAVEIENPTGYGRLIFNADRKLIGIVEEADANADQKRLCIVNAGIYCADKAFLTETVMGLQPDNAQGELYLTDIVAMAAAQGRCIGEVMAADPEEVIGVNTPVELANVATLLGRRMGNIS